MTYINQENNVPESYVSYNLTLPAEIVIVDLFILLNISGSSLALSTKYER